MSHLKHRDVVLPVDLVGRRVEPAALLHVLVEDAAALHVAEAELAQVELRQSGERDDSGWERGEGVEFLMHRHKSREEVTEGEGGRCGDPFALKSPGINFNIRNFNQIGKLVRDTFHVAMWSPEFLSHFLFS